MSLLICSYECPIIPARTHISRISNLIEWLFMCFQRQNKRWRDAERNNWKRKRGERNEIFGTEIKESLDNIENCTALLRFKWVDVFLGGRGVGFIEWTKNVGVGRGGGVMAMRIATDFRQPVGRRVMMGDKEIRNEGIWQMETAISIIHDGSSQQYIEFSKGYLDREHSRLSLRNIVTHSGSVWAEAVRLLGEWGWDLIKRLANCITSDCSWVNWSCQNESQNSWWSVKTMRGCSDCSFCSLNQMKCSYL